MSLITDAGTANYIDNYDGGDENSFYFIKSGGTTSPETTESGNNVTLSNYDQQPTSQIGQVKSIKTTMVSSDLNFTWEIESSKSPQFYYSLKIYDNANYTGVSLIDISSNSPHLREENIDISSLPNNREYYYQFFINDIFDETSNIKNGSFVKGELTEGSSTIIDEGFDTATWPPTGWTQSVTNAANTWKLGNPQGNNFSSIDQSSQASAICPYDDNVYQEEYLFSPLFSLPNGSASLEFYAGYSTAWLTGATMTCWVTSDAGQNWTAIWEANNDGQTWKWRKQELDLSAYTGNQNVALRWGYIGQGGDLVGLDGVQVISNSTVGVEDSKDIPISFSLEQNFPNPFNPTTTIQYYINLDSQVKIIIYDLKGHEVNTIVNEYKTIGNHMIQWNGKDNLEQSVSGGIYFYKLQAGDFIQTNKMILLK